MVGVTLVAALVDDAAVVDVGVVLVGDAELVEHRVGGWHLQGGDVLNDVPEALEMLTHLAATAGDEPLLGVAVAVEGAAGNREFLEDRDVRAGHLAVANEECGSGQGGDAGPDDVGLPLGDVVGGNGPVVGVGAQVVVDVGVAVRADRVAALVDVLEVGHDSLPRRMSSGPRGGPLS